MNASGTVQWAKSKAVTGEEKLSSIVTNAAGDVYVAGSLLGSGFTFGTSTLTNAVATKYDAFIAKYAASGTEGWAKNNSNGTEDDYINSLDVDSDGNLYAVGWSYSTTIQFDAKSKTNTNGFTDGYLLKMTPTGGVSWISLIQGDSNETAYDVVVDANNAIYVAGKTQSPSVFVTNLVGTESIPISASSAGGDMAYIFRFDTNGLAIWVESDSSKRLITAITKDASNALFVIGKAVDKKNLFITKYENYDRAKTVISTADADNRNNNPDFNVSDIIAVDSFGSIVYASWDSKAVVRKLQFSLCKDAKASNLPTGYAWYTAATAGTAVAADDVLTNTATYYGAAVVNSVESTTRLEFKPNLVGGTIFYVDNDNDEYSSGETSCFSAGKAPLGYVLHSKGKDCDDTNPAITYQVSEFYKDADGDGYTVGNSIYLCASKAPVGYSSYNLGPDCNDADKTKYITYYVDADADGRGASSSNNICSGAVSTPAGYSTNNSDCDDSNVAIYNGVVYYNDNDNDGAGGYYAANYVCTNDSFQIPSGYTSNNSDCNDANASLKFGETYLVDADGDGYTTGVSVFACLAAPTTAAPAGTVYYSIPNSRKIDCDDTNSQKQMMLSYFIDADNDGYKGISDVTTDFCFNTNQKLTGYVLATTAAFNAVDCNDAVSTIHPNADEVFFNNVDEDCNGFIDDAKITTMTVAAGTDAIYSQSVSNTQGYRFNVVIQSTGASLTFEKTTNSFTLNELGSTIYSIYEVYTVKVALKNNGTWQPYGPTTEIQTPRPTTKLVDALCNGTLTSLTSFAVNITPLTVATGYKVLIDNGQDEVVLYKTSAGFNISEIPYSILSSSTKFNISVGIQYKNQYREMGSICVLTTTSPSVRGGLTKPTNSAAVTASPSIGLTGITCGSTLPKLCTTMYCSTVVGASSYVFEVTSQAGVVKTITKTANSFTITDLPGAVAYNATYGIRVAAVVNGSQSAFGATCSITTPSPSTVVGPKLVSALCGSNLTSKWNVLYCGQVPGATSYRFSFTNGSTSLSFVSPTNSMQMYYLSGRQLATTYTVTIAALIDGSYSAEGTACTVTTPATNARLMTEDETPFEVRVVPNPSVSDFAIIPTGGSNNPIQVSVFDMTGRLVEQFTAEANQLQDQSLGNAYTAGVYNIAVTQDDETKVVRLIKH
jgi:hypothetical protein